MGGARAICFVVAGWLAIGAGAAAAADASGPAAPGVAPVATPPTAPSADALPAGMREALALAYCARLRPAVASPAGADNYVGDIADAAERGRLVAIARRIPPDSWPQFKSAATVPGVCRSLVAFDALRAAAAAAGALVARAEGSSSLFREGDPIALAVSGSAVPLHLRIDYFTLDGQVLHMWPSRREPNVALAARRERVFGKSGEIAVGGAPFGVEFVGVVGTAQPLDLGHARPVVERATDYLKDFRAALRRQHGTAAPAAFATLLVHTAPRTGNLTAAAAAPAAAARPGQCMPAGWTGPPLPCAEAASAAATEPVRPAASSAGGTSEADFVKALTPTGPGTDRPASARAPAAPDAVPAPTGINSIRPVSSPADAALATLKDAFVGFDAPAKMTVGDERDVTAVLTHGLGRDVLTALLQQPGQSPAPRGSAAPLRVADLVSASLAGDDGLTVAPRGEQNQWVSLGQPSEWRWRVAAAAPGHHRLTVRFFAGLSLAGESGPRLIKTLSKTIAVRVAPGLLSRVMASPDLREEAAAGAAAAIVVVAGGIAAMAARRRQHAADDALAEAAVAHPERKPPDLDGFVHSASAATAEAEFTRWAGGHRVTLAIVFTDIVGSTELGESVKDQHMSIVRRTHFTQSRRLIKQYDGREIKTIGDSVMSAFRNVEAALDYACALHRDPGRPELRIRAGIHIGPMSIEGDDVFGRTVNFAARVIGAIKGAEIWVSEHAKADIDAAGARHHQELHWQRRDDNELKGFPGTYALWQLLDAEKTQLSVRPPQLAAEAQQSTAGS
jgi:class 3 adenylate cyclase